MNDNTPQDTALNFNFTVPQDKEAGEYADGLFVYHAPNGFRVDFYQSDPMLTQATEKSITQKVLVVARLHISHGAMGDMVEALQTNWNQYVEKAAPTDI